MPKHKTTTYLQHSAEIQKLKATSFVNASLLEECLLLHWFIFPCLQPIVQISETTSTHFIIKLSPRYCYCSSLVKALKEEMQLFRHWRHSSFKVPHKTRENKDWSQKLVSFIQHNKIFPGRFSTMTKYKHTQNQSSSPKNSSAHRQISSEHYNYFCRITYLKKHNQQLINYVQGFNYSVSAFASSLF